MPKHRKRGGKAGGRAPARQWTYDAHSLNNAAFEEYYKAQGIIPQDEWDTFMSILKTELPTTFRVTGSRSHAETINKTIRDVYVPTMQNVELDGVKYEPPEPMSWYPEGLAWQVAAPKRVVRRQPAFKVFQRFLVGETEVGNLSRQEAVSMIPPLLLDVQPHHRCIDMCAAPGSKTAQIIEALNPHHTESTGLLIANDSDYKRTHMLVHQTGRMPSKGLLVTNYDASAFPNLSLGSEGTLTFDRILADVPCSGDATLRKNMEIWGKWGPVDGSGLHPLQLRILDRAMNMLKPGGRLVYSTCSFNPVENEAVICAALNSRPGEFHIVDVSEQLPGLKRRPGMNDWKVATQPPAKNGELVFHESYETYRESADAGNERDKDRGKGLAKTLWPPTNAADLTLDRCLRLLPHDQNTGGFFVCVLEKASKPGPKVPATVDIASLPEPDLKDIMTADEGSAAAPLTTKRPVSPSAPEGPEDVEGTSASGQKKAKPEANTTKKAKSDLGFREDPFSFVDPSHSEIDTIVNWFALTESFPRNYLLVRNAYGDPLRTIYITNPIVKTVILNNDYTRMRLISAGIKTFVRQDSQARQEYRCKWRVSSDGVGQVLDHVKEGVVVEASIKDLRVLIAELYPPMERFEGPFRQSLDAAELGNMVVKFNAGEESGGKLDLPMYLSVWRSKASMSLLVDKREKSVLSLRVFGEDIVSPTQFKKSETAENTPAESGADEGEDVGEETLAKEEMDDGNEEAAFNV